jgi:solute carrier family 35 protein F5
MPNCFNIIPVLLKKFAGGEGSEKVDVQKLFGFLGLFTLCLLWWLGKIFLFANLVA